MKRARVWVYTPPRAAKPKIDDLFKWQVKDEADRLIASVLKPRYVQPPPDKPTFNYVTDIFAKWRGSSLYFYAKYACPGPDAISPSFEERFARLEYAGDKRFHLAYMRHTEQWETLHAGLTLAQAIDAIRDEPHFAL
jgi:hypothetical protein